MSKRIHVATRESIDRPGGLHNYVKCLAAGQRRLGHDVTVIDQIGRRGTFNVAEGADPTADFVDGEAIVEFHFAHSALPILRRYSYLRKSPRRVMHFHGPWYAEGRAHGEPILRSIGKLLVEARMYRLPNLHFTAASAAFAEILAKKFRIDRKMIDVVYPGVDTERFRPGDKRDARRLLDLPQDEFIFTCVRRLEPRMGVDVAIQAMKILPDARLVICGDGSSQRHLRALTAELGLEPRVTFLGKVSEAQLPSVYRAADVSVVPTIALEGFGLVVLESFSSGRPVITTDVGGLMEAQGPFGSEWSVPAGSVSALADRMALAVLNPPGCRESSEVRQFAKTRSLQVAAKDMDDVLLRACS
jgi:glycosyltransferase involved in cell wall biosynthesis